MDYHARYINLPHRTDRLAHMEAQLSRISLKAEPIRGMYPQEYTGDENKVAVMRRRTPGAIGCYESQVRIMREALAFGKTAVVMEDDCVFSNSFDQGFSIIEEWCKNNDWDIFYLGSAMHISDKDAPFWHPLGPSKMNPDVSANLGYDAKRTDHPRIIQTFAAFDTFCYLVNVASIEKVVRMLEEYCPQSIGIDHNMIYWQPRGMKSFAFLPGLVRQMTNQSDIGNGITNWDGFLNLGPFVFQDNIDNFNPDTFNFGVCR